MMGLGKGKTHFKHGQFLVSKIKFLGLLTTYEIPGDDPPKQWEISPLSIQEIHHMLPSLKLTSQKYAPKNGMLGI